MGQATWQGGNFALGAGTVADQQVASLAGINASKLQHGYYFQTNFCGVIGATPTSQEFLAHVANSAGVLQDFSAMLNVVGSANMTVDLLKNGSSVLSAPISLTNALSNRQVATATITTSAYNAGDVFSIKVIVTTGTGASGLMAWAGAVETSPP